MLVGVLVPALTVVLTRAAGRRQGAARSELTAELVELLRGAPELVVYGREDDTLARIRTRSGELARLGRRDALAAGLAEGLSILIAGLTVAGVLAVAADASVDRVLVATAALLALASFECVTPLRSSAAELWATIAAGRRSCLPLYFFFFFFFFFFFVANASVDRVLIATAALLALASFECVIPLRSSAAELWTRSPPAAACSSSSTASRPCAIPPSLGRHRSFPRSWRSKVSPPATRPDCRRR